MTSIPSTEAARCAASSCRFLVALQIVLTQFILYSILPFYATQKRLFRIFAGKAAFDFEKRVKNLSVEILEKKLCTFNKKSSVF